MIFLVVAHSFRFANVNSTVFSTLVLLQSKPIHVKTCECETRVFSLVTILISPCSPLRVWILYCRAVIKTRSNNSTLIKTDEVASLNREGVI